MTELTIPDIAINEKRDLRITPSGLTTGYESRSYQLRVSDAVFPKTSLLTVNYGPSQWVSGSGWWLVELTAAQTATLPEGSVLVGGWELGRPEPLFYVSLTTGTVP